MCPIEFVTPSPQALKYGEVQKKMAEQKYPFDKLEAGQSFRLPVAEGNFQSLKSLSSLKSKDGKRYVVVHHEELGFFEVYRKS